MFTYLYFHIYIYKYIYRCVYAYIYIYVFVHIYIYMCVYVFVYMHIHTYIHTYIHIYIYIYGWPSRCPQSTFVPLLGNSYCFLLAVAAQISRRWLQANCSCLSLWLSCAEGFSEQPWAQKQDQEKRRRVLASHRQGLLSMGGQFGIGSVHGGRPLWSSGGAEPPLEGWPPSGVWRRSEASSVLSRRSEGWPPLGGEGAVAKNAFFFGAP